MEDSNHFKKRIKSLERDTLDYVEFDNFFDFEKIKKLLPYSMNIKPFKLKNKNIMNLNMKTEFTILRKFSINIQDIDQLIELKITSFMDYLIAGSLKFILISKENFNEENIKTCVVQFQGCQISEKLNKNTAHLSVIISKGDYFLLIIENQNKEYIEYIRKIINYIPFSIDLNVKYVKPNESFFSCSGSPLINNLGDIKQNDFHLKGEYSIFLNNKNNKMSFKLQKNSIIQLSVEFKEAENINFKIYKIDNKENVLIDESLQTENFSSIITSVKSGIEYIIIFNFLKDSIINEYVINPLSNCLNFKLNLSIKSNEFLQTISECNKPNLIDQFILDFFNLIKKSNLSEEIISSTSDLFSFNVQNLNSLSILYSKEINLITEHPILLHYEIYSDIDLITELNNNKNINKIHTLIDKNIPSLKFSILNYSKSEANYEFLPKCVQLKIRLTAFKLSYKKNKNWRCKNENFNILPHHIELSNSPKYEWKYFNQNVILPYNNLNNLKIKTSLERGHLLKFEYEINDNINQLYFSFKLNSNKNEKIEIIKKENSIMAYLSPNSEYSFDTIVENLDKYSFYDNCLTMKLNFRISSYSQLENAKKCPNERIIPMVDDIKIERIIGKENSFGIYQITDLFIKSQATEKEKKSSDNISPVDNTSELNSRRIISYKKTKLFGKFKHIFNFDINSFMARVTVYLTFLQGENYTTLVGYIKKKDDFSSESVLQKTSLGGNGNNLIIKGVNLEFGNYILEIKDEDELNDFYEDLCVKISVVIIIENVAYDSYLITSDTMSNTCSLINFPTELNLPGLINIDTDNTLIDNFKSKMSNRNNFKFHLKFLSEIKIVLPNVQNSNLYSHMKIDFIRNTTMSDNFKNDDDLILKTEENYLIKTLYPGVYSLDIIFEGLPFEIFSKSCYYFEMEISIQPYYNIRLPDICKENNSKSNILTGNYLTQIFANNEYNNLSINMKIKKEDLIWFDIQPIYSPGQFLSKFTYNNYLSNGVNVKVYKKIETNSSSYLSFKDVEQSLINSKILEVNAEITYIGNIIWTLFKVEKGFSYYMHIIPYLEKRSDNNFNYKCLLSYVSYEYEDKSRELGMLESIMTNIEKEEQRKEICSVTDYLPIKIASQNLFGEFLFPQGINHTRTFFKIDEKSLIFVKILSSTDQHINTFIDIHNTGNENKRIGYSDNNSVIFKQLDKGDYVLSITFLNREGDFNKCSSYKFIIQIIQYNDYVPQPKIFESSKKKYSKLTTNKLITLESESNSFIDYATYLKFDENVFNLNKESGEYEFAFNIEIINDLHKNINFTAEIYLDYLITDNSIDFKILNDKKESIQNSIENILKIPVSNEIIVQKYIENVFKLDPKNTKNNLKIHLNFNKNFKEKIESAFDDDDIKNKIINKFYFPFNLKMIFTTNINNDDNNNSNELSKLSKFNHLLFVNPPELNNLQILNENVKLENNLIIGLEFSNEFDSYVNQNVSIDKDEIFLIPNDKKSSSNSIKPVEIKTISNKKIKLIFELSHSKGFTSGVCYLLKFNFNNKNRKYIYRYNSMAEYKYCTSKNFEVKKPNKSYPDEKKIKRNRCEDGKFLPERLFDEDSKFIGGQQSVDGSIEINAILISKNLAGEEISEFKISDDSIVRLYLNSLNDKKVKYEVSIHKELEKDPIAYFVSTDSSNDENTLVAYLKRNILPYFIRIKNYYDESTNLSKCFQYQLRLSIKPSSIILDQLKCSTLIYNNRNNASIQSAYLPDNDIILGENPLNEIIFNERSFMMIEDFIKNGYEINLKVKNEILISISVSYPFVANHIILILKNKNGKEIKRSTIIGFQNENVISSLDFVSKRSIEYKLMILQTKNMKDLLDIAGTAEGIMKCFKFDFNIQTTVLKENDTKIENRKLNNKLISVQPESFSHIRIDKKFEIIIEFSNLIEKSTYDDVKSSKQIYLKNNSKEQKIFPDQIILNSNNKSLIIKFNPNSLQNENCYELVYDNIKNVEIDKNLTHKFCTKKCDCNKFTEFECDRLGRCICEKPYTGEGCKSCISGYLMLDNKCLTSESCREKECKSRGKCLLSNSNSLFKNGNDVICECDEGYTAEDCSECVDSEKIYPNCSKIVTTGKTPSINNTIKDATSKFDIHKESTDMCEHSMIHSNLDSLGYLSADHNLHISGLYSLKHKKNVNISFTIKEKSHLKVYIEHSMNNFIVNIYLFGNNRDHIVKSNYLHGPGGKNTATYIEVSNLPPIHFPGSKYIFSEYKIELEILEVENLKISSECFNIFLELQITNYNNYAYSSNNFACNYDLPYIFMPIFMFDKEHISKKDLFLNLSSQRSVLRQHSLNIKNNPSDKINYFHSEYFYIPDYKDEEIIINLEVYSKFTTDHIGVLVEVLKLPNRKLNNKINYKNISPFLFKKYHEDLGMKKPQCESNLCLTGVKKYNGFILKKEFPRDTFVKLWYYYIYSDLTHNISHCLLFDKSFDVYKRKIIPESNIKTNEIMPICTSAELPNSLNTKGYLGDKFYLQKWGFHIFDNFNINKISHKIEFSIEEYHLLKIKILSELTKIDIELFYISNKDEKFKLAELQDDQLTIELPPANYYLNFKFFTDSDLFSICKEFLMEFSMAKSTQVQENVNRLISKHKNMPVLKEINLYNLLTYVRRLESNVFLIPISKAIEITHTDEYHNKLIQYQIIDMLKFKINDKNSNLIELVASASSDFLLLNAEFYLIENTTGKEIKSEMKKNYNLLLSSPLDKGEYSLELRYLPRLHFKDKRASLESISLKNVNYLELEIEIELISKSNDTLYLDTDKGSININLSQNNRELLYRPIPTTLNNLRYLEFNYDMHIQDIYMVPDTAKHTIKFKINLIEKIMFRIYIECFGTDIDIQLFEIGAVNKLLAESNFSSMFETIMQIIKGETLYELVLIFKLNKDSKLHTFKMQIATEVSHSLACPESNSSYSKLDKVNPIPKNIPKDVNFKYDSKNTFKGEALDSGYLYLLRNKHDTTIRYSEFINIENIDLKFEVINDFIQAPVNVYITKSSQKSNESEADDNILNYGDMQENRNILFIQNLPPGHYLINIYVPGLKTLFEYEKTVCSLYDILIEIRKSNQLKLASNSEILDIPTFLPTHLNYKQFLDTNSYETDKQIVHNENYFINYKNIFHWREINEAHMHQMNKNVLLNSLQFSLEKDSYVRFEVKQLISKDFKDKIFLSIDDFKLINDNSFIHTFLSKGKHTIFLTKYDVKFSHFDILSLINSFELDIGIEEFTRPAYVLNNNYVKKCLSSKLQNRLISNNKGEIVYSNNKIVINLTNNKFIQHKFEKIELKETSNKVFIHIGGDFVLFNMNVIIKSEDDFELKTASHENNLNVKTINAVLPKGIFEIILNVENNINAASNIFCFIFSLDIFITKFYSDHLPQSIPLNRSNFNNLSLTFIGNTYNNEVSIKLSKKSLIKIYTFSNLYAKLKNDLIEVKESYDYQDIFENTKLWVVDPKLLNNLELNLNNFSKNLNKYKFGRLTIDINSIENIQNLFQCKGEKFLLPKNSISINKSENKFIDKFESYITPDIYSSYIDKESDEFSYKLKLNFDKKTSIDIEIELKFYNLISYFTIELVQYEKSNSKNINNSAFVNKVIAKSEVFETVNSTDQRGSIYTHKSLLKFTIENESDEVEYFIKIKEKQWHKVYNIILSEQINSTSTRDNILCVPISYTINIINSSENPNKEKSNDVIIQIDDLNNPKLSSNFYPMSLKNNLAVNNNISKCGVNGKLIYDHILKAKECFCLNGYSGKECDMCLGKEEKINDMNICSNYEIMDSLDNQNHIINVNKNITCNECLNGVCDVRTGHCICYPSYKKINCGKKILSKSSLVMNPEIKDKLAITNHSPYPSYLSTTLFYLFIKFILLFIVFITINYFYNKFRSSSASHKNSYTPVSNEIDNSEFEMAYSKNINSINLELEDNSLIEN